MNTLSLFYISSKHQLRLNFPNNIARHSIIFIGAVLLVGGLILGITFGIHPPPQWKGGFRSPDFVNNLSGLFFLLNISVLFFPTFMTIRSVLKLVNNPDPISLILLSPLSAFSKFTSSVGPILLFSSIPFFIVVLPFVVLFLFLDPLISFVTILYFIVVSGWSVVLCFFTIAGLINFFGRNKAARIAYAFPLILVFLPSVFSYALEDIRYYAPVIGYWQFIFFSISIALLPPIFSYSCKLFYSLITTTEQPAKEFAEPVWGNYNPWIFLKRHAVSLAMIPSLIFIVLMIVKIVRIEGLNAGIFAMAIFTFVTSPVGVLMQEEKINLDRWLLAPYSFTVKKAIWIKVNLPLFLLGSGAVIIMGIGHIAWIILVLSLILLSLVNISAHAMYKIPIVQLFIYFALLFCELSTQLAWK